MIDPDLLKRIRKCLALGASPNEHEAAAALEMARKLMQSHGITDHDLQMAEIGDASARGSRTIRPPSWESILSVTVCRALDVVSLIDADRDRRFIGRGAAPDIAAYAFATLFRVLKRARGAYILSQLKRCGPARKRARADAYCEGWAAAVFTKIAALYPRVEDDVRIGQYITERFGAVVPVARRSTSARRTDADRWRGWDQGETVDLHKGVGATSLTRGQLAYG